jgi:signal transduction histidine kinase
MAVSVDPVIDEAGNLVQVVQIVRDITERKKAEEALREQFRQISTIFDGLHVIAHVVDSVTHELVYLNNYAAAIFGNHWQGKRCQEVIKCGYPYPCTLTEEELPARGGEASQQRIYVYENNFTNRWYQCVEKRMFWVDGRYVHITVAIDITDLKNMMQMQDDFLSSVSHEMKTPLTAICGYTDFLLENRVDEVNMHDYLGIIQKESKRLDELLDNLLTMQRLKAKPITEEIRKLDLLPLLEETVAVFAARSAKHRIIPEFAHDLAPVLIRQGHMNDLLSNLLTNAIKYSPGGGEIALGAKRENDGTVTLWVRDQGIGIPPDVLGKVFEKFYQVESGNRRAFGGIGLGLALVKEIANAYGGRAWVESTLGKGSTFFLSLPAGEG